MDLSKKKVLLSNGCSHTHGSDIVDERGYRGMSEEQYEKLRNINKNLSFSGRLASLYGMELNNIAIPGGCNERIIRTTIMWCNKYLNQEGTFDKLFVVIGWTSANRYEIKYNGEYYIALPGYSDFYLKPTWYKEMFKYLITYSDFDFEINKKAAGVISLSSYFQHNNIDYIMLNAQQPIEKDYIKSRDEFRNFYPPKNFFEPYDSFFDRFQDKEKYPHYSLEKGGHWGRDIHYEYAKYLAMYIKDL